MTTVLLADADFSDLELERLLLADAGFELVTAESARSEALRAAAPEAAGVLVQWTRVGRDLLDALPCLRVVGRFGVGTDAIDVPEASRRGIAVVSSGDYATEEVAAHALALTLAVLRAVPAGDRAVREGTWIDAGHFQRFRRLSGLRAGVVGLGRIGRRFAAYLAALGMEVEGYDPYSSNGDFPTAGSLEELLERSDLVSLHVPLTNETENLLDRERLGLMPAGAVLVNVARGCLVDEEALVERLREGHLGGAALDVFGQEPVGRDHPLCGFDNVVLSPHVAYFSQESVVEARTRTVAGVVAALRGEVPRDAVNLDALSTHSPGAGG